MRRPWGPGWALVGDAGYWKDPISAHGLTDALRDAELLARAVIGAGGGCTVMDAALRGYQETRDRLSFPLFDVTDALASFTWTDDDIGATALGDELLDEGRGRRDRRARRRRRGLLTQLGGGGCGGCIGGGGGGGGGTQPSTACTPSSDTCSVHRVPSK